MKEGRDVRRRGWIAALLLAALLCGCADEYLTVTPHTEPGADSDSTDATVAENYLSCRRPFTRFPGRTPWGRTRWSP